MLRHTCTGRIYLHEPGTAEAMHALSTNMATHLDLATIGMLVVFRVPEAWRLLFPVGGRWMPGFTRNRFCPFFIFYDSCMRAGGCCLAFDLTSPHLASLSLDTQVCFSEHKHVDSLVLLIRPVKCPHPIRAWLVLSSRRCLFSFFSLFPPYPSPSLPLFFLSFIFASIPTQCFSSIPFCCPRVGVRNPQGG